jgi:hypothetical protein
MRLPRVRFTVQRMMAAVPILSERPASPQSSGRGILAGPGRRAASRVPGAGPRADRPGTRLTCTLFQAFPRRVV